jgi:16S rRNA (guanine(966)-N(2))-methyltransferase RsmD
MLDRVREALFSILGAEVEGARVLDLFAGTGSLGLEALSRGAGAARFVEGDARCARILRDNVAALGLAERAEVVVGDALSPRTWHGEEDVPSDVIFLDPPYPLLRGETRGELFRALGALVAARLAPEGVLVFHAPRREVRPSELEPFEVDERQYGTSALYFLRRREER